MTRLNPKVLALALLIGAASPALAQTDDIERALVAQLQALGFDEIVVGHTLLGRIRIDARLGEMRREIVVNPNTGEILRDWQGQDLRVARGSDGGASGAIGTGVTATATREGGLSVTSDVSVPDIVDHGAKAGGE